MASSSFKALATQRPNAPVLMQQPDTPRAVTLDSPALEVMTDFARAQPVAVAPDASLFAANETMVTRGVRLLLVVDDKRSLLGVLSTRDTLGERPMQLVHQGKGNLFDLTVSDLMHPLGQIDVLDYNDVRHACVGDVVATLRSLGQQHVLVLARDGDSRPPQVRGVFSATQEVARTFAEIEATLAG